MNPIMLKRNLSLMALCMLSLFLPFTLLAAPIIADHTTASTFSNIPLSAIANAKADLHIAYGHSSHGHQLIEGTKNLDAYMTGKGSPAGTFAVKYDGTASTDQLDFFDSPWRLKLNWQEYGRDLGSGTYDGNVTMIDQDYNAWFWTTRKYLGWIPGSGDTNHLANYATGTPAYNPARCNNCNVIIWSWCGQASYNGPEGPTHVTEAIKEYLAHMAQLELDYPMVKFVYMTGHVDGYPGYSALRANNDSIKEFCNLNNKILYDFEDIESWDPDGNYYGDKHVTYGCNWDANENDTTSETPETGGAPATPLNGDRNWALEWQDAHPGDWYECYLLNAHTQHLNHNLKAYTFWWLMARLAGWDGTGVEKQRGEVPQVFNVLQNYPNPFNPSTIISYQLLVTSYISLKIYDILGREITTLVNEVKIAGTYTVQWDGKNSDGQTVGSGVYFYQLQAGVLTETKKLVLVR
jgi:hypothetical protein